MMISKIFFRILKTEQKVKNERISFLVSTLRTEIFKVRNGMYFFFKFQIGSTVLIKGLQTYSDKRYNGWTGEVIRGPDKKGCFAVKFLNGAERFFETENMELVRESEKVNFCLFFPQIFHTKKKVIFLCPTDKSEKN
jgi:hypothetical protein